MNQGEMESAVLQTLFALNKACTKGDVNDLAQYFHKRVIAFASDAKKRLEGRTACVTACQRFRETAHVISWAEIEPKVVLFGAVAIVTYCFSFSYEKASVRHEVTGDDLMTFIQENEKWWAIAGRFPLLSIAA